MNVYVELGKLTEKLDILSQRMNDLEKQQDNINTHIANSQREFEEITAKAEALAEQHGLPFVYSYKKDEEDSWESSEEDYWESSNC